MLESHNPHSSQQKQNQPNQVEGALPHILPAQRPKHHGANPSKLPNNSPKFISAHVRTNQQARERSNTAYPSPRGGRRLLRGVGWTTTWSGRSAGRCRRRSPNPQPCPSWRDTSWPSMCPSFEFLSALVIRSPNHPPVALSGNICTKESHCTIYQYFFLYNFHFCKVNILD